MKNLPRLLILFIPFLLLSCDVPWCKKDFSGRVQIYYANRMSREYGVMYEHSTSPVKPLDYLVQLPEFTPFEWDTLIWVSDSLRPEDITKIIGTRYEDKNVYKGKRKLIFMNDGEVVDIYALKKGDEFSLIPGDERGGYAGISRDTWFTVRANGGNFILKRFGVSNIHIPQDLSESRAKHGPRFKLDIEGYNYGLSSDTMESRRERTLANVVFDMSPLAREMGKKILTKDQLSCIKQNDISISVVFTVYLDNGDISGCFWCIDEGKSTDFVSEEQWEQLSEIVLNMRIDPRCLYQPYPWIKYPAGKRIYTNWMMYITSALRD